MRWLLQVEFLKGYLPVLNEGTGIFIHQLLFVGVWEVGELTPDYICTGKSSFGKSPVFPGGTVRKNPPASAGGARDAGSVSGLGRSPGVVNGNPLHYSCLENSVDRGAWWTIVRKVVKSQTWLSTHITIIWDKEMQIPVIERTGICWSGKAGVRWKILLKVHTLIFCVIHVLY